MMGASSWSYFVPYQPDIEQALQELRQGLFDSGKCYQIDPYWREMTFEKFIPPDPTILNDAEEMAAYREEWERLQALPEPTTIEELLYWNGEEGTHSILDIEHVAEEQGVGVVAPLDPDRLLQFFGTEQPTREHILERKSEFDQYLQRKLGRYRSEGTYVIVYRDGVPSEIFFTGYSGD